MYIRKLIFTLYSFFITQVLTSKSINIDYTLGLSVGTRSELTEANSAVYFIEDINPDSPRSLTCWQVGFFAGLGRTIEKPFSFSLGTEYGFLYIKQNSWAKHQIPQLACAEVTNLDLAWTQTLDFYYRLDNLFSHSHNFQTQFNIGLAVTRHEKIISKIHIQILDPYLPAEETRVTYMPKSLRLGMHLATRLNIQLLAISLDYFFLPFALSKIPSTKEFASLNQHSFSFCFSININQVFLSHIRKMQYKTYKKCNQSLGLIKNQKTL